MLDAKQKMGDFLSIIFLALISVAFFVKVIFSGETLYGSDFLFYFYPIKRFIYESVSTQGVPSFWNPHLFSGTPLIANIQASMFYPPGFLYYLVPAEVAYFYVTLLHCIIGAVFMYLFLRSLSVSKGGAFISGFVFMFNGYFMAHLYAGHLSFIQTYVWIPLIFLFLFRFVRLGLYINVLMAGLILGIQILGGFPQLAFYTMLAGLLFFLFSGCTTGKSERAQYFIKMSGAAAVFIVIGFSIAAVQLLPTHEFTRLSTRAGGIGYQFATMDSLPPRNLLTFLVPLLFGTPVDNTYWINDATWEFWEYCGYAGIGAMVITLLTARRLVTDRASLFFLILAAISLFLAFGKYNPLYPFIYHLPGFNHFRIPAQILFLYVFSISVLAGKGLDFLQRLKPFSDGSKRIVFILMLLFLPLIIWSYGFTENFSSFLFSHLAFTQMRVEKLGRIVSVVSRAVFVSYGILWAFVVVLYLYRKKSISYATVTAMFILISVADLGSFSAPMIQTVDMGSIRGKGRLLRSLREDPVLWRSTVHGRCFIENAGLWYGFQDIQGYDPLILKRYMEYVNRSQDLPPDEKVVNLHYISRFDNNLIRLLNLRYIVACTAHRLAEINDFIPRCYIVHGMEIRDRKEILDFMMEEGFDPLKKVVFEKGLAPDNYVSKGPDFVSRDKCRITSYDNDAIKLDVRMGAPGFLVMSEISYPGWRVFVNGVQKEILTGNYLFRVVPLDAGRHEVHFMFSPLSFKVGAMISLISMIGVIALSFFLRRNRPVEKEGRSSALRA
jgi:hypothetical protein